MKPLEAFNLIDKFIFNARCSEDIHIKSVIGALGIRKDGAIIRAVNGSIRNSFGESNSTGKNPPSKSSRYHAEGRLLNKIDSGATIYVSRRRRDIHEYAMARPCDRCRPKLISYRVNKVFYTINNFCYGIWTPSTDTDKVIFF